MFEFNWEPHGVRWRYYGTTSGEEIVSASKLIYGDPRFDDLRYKLVDLVEADSFAMERHDIAEIASQHKAAALSNPNVKTAIIVKESCVEQAAYFASLFRKSTWVVRIFHDPREADAWLGRMVPA